MRQLGILVLATLCGFVWGVRTLLAQSATLRGTVVNMATRLPVPRARIMAGDREVLADDTGRYAMELPGGTYDVTVEADGYIGMTYTRQELPHSESVFLEIEMVPENPTEGEAAEIEARMLGEAQALPDDIGPDIQSQGYGLSSVSEVPETIRVLMPDGSVEVMEMDEYLKGVVPREVSPSWQVESLRAQAVAARSYAATQRKHLHQGADVCTEVHCQAWGPVQFVSTSRAVEDTSRVAALYNNQIISTYFHGNCDGRTRNSEDVWGGYLPYCRAVDCSCGYTTRYGHGVGMCQRGARAMAQQGYGYEEILKHYYTGITVSAAPAGTVSAALLNPGGGDENTLFTFQAMYTSRTNEPPAVANVHVSGRANALLRVDGGTEGPWTYRGSLRLPAGQHSYRFYFDDGRGRTAVSPTAGGLVVAAAPAGAPTPAPVPVSPQGPLVSHMVQSTVTDWETGARSGTRVATMGDGALTLADGQTQGSYTSPVWTAPFSFMALALRWHADYPAGSDIVFEVRTGADGATWSPWRVLEIDEDDEGRGDNVYSSDLLVAVGRVAQYRVTLRSGVGGASPVLRNVRLIGIDASQGPTAQELAAEGVTPMSTRPPVISRAGWGADESLMTWSPQYRPLRAVVIHHTVTGQGGVDPAAVVRAIYYYHAIEREWGDIGYNYLVDHMGNIYEGRAGGVGVVGGHARSYNWGSIGMAIIGDYEQTPVPAAALERLTSFLAWQCADHLIHPTQSRYFIDRELPTIFGHRDVANTKCPGDQAYPLLPTIRSQTLTKMASVPPNLTITAPMQGQAVRAVTRVDAQTSAAVTRVDFHVDGVLRATRTAAPFSWPWNTIHEAAGQHTLRVVAHNSAGQKAQEITVTVDNTPPTGSVSVPTWVTSATVPFTISGDATAVQFSNDWIWPASALGQASGVWNQGHTRVWYGPYTCDLSAPADYQVYYRLRTTNNGQDTGIAIIDAADNMGLRVYAQRALTGSDFARENTYEEFSLPLAYAQKAPTCAAPGAGNGLEFRTWFSTIGNPALDRVAVFGAPVARGGSPISWVVRDTEGEQRVLVRLLDVAGNATEREVTVRLDRTPPHWPERDDRSAWVQDTVSGLNVQSAEWSSTDDSGRTWTPWQPLALNATMGTTQAVQLVAPAEAGRRVRFRIRDVAGNISESRPRLQVNLPIISRDHPEP
jgi:hypothetical protein